MVASMWNSLEISCWSCVSCAEGLYLYERRLCNVLMLYVYSHFALKPPPFWGCSQKPAWWMQQGFRTLLTCFICIEKTCHFDSWDHRINPSFWHVPIYGSISSSIDPTLSIQQSMSWYTYSAHVFLWYVYVKYNITYLFIYVIYLPSTWNWT